MDEELFYKKHVAKNALRIFKLNIDYDLFALKERYKQLVRVHHPDKGGDQESFLYITKCFKYLYRELEKRSEKTFDQLRSGARASSEPIPPPPKGLRGDGEEFSRKFNALYEEHGIPDAAVKKGYDEFIANSTVEVDDTANFKVDRYRPPSPQHLCGKMGFMDLGEMQETDFTGKNDVKNGLQFMDYRKAHTTGKLVDESVLHERVNFNSLEDLKSKRESANFEMNEEEERRYNHETRKHTRKELERQAKIKRHDSKLFTHFESVRRSQIA